LNKEVVILILFFWVTAFVGYILMLHKWVEHLLQFLFLFLLVKNYLSLDMPGDVEEIYYRQEERREQEQVDQGEPMESGGDSQPPSEGSGSSSTRSSGSQDVNIYKRAQEYIKAYKIAKSASSNTNVIASNNSVNKIVTPTANDTYDAIFKLRCKNMDVQSLGGSTSNVSNQLGCFKPDGEAWGEPPVERHVFGSRQNISLNFDPVTMICKSCNDAEHRILSGGWDNNAERKIFVLADQSFPAELVGGGGGGLRGCGPNGVWYPALWSVYVIRKGREKGWLVQSF
jgi:hypothetical protein